MAFPLLFNPSCAESLRSLFGLAPEQVSNGQKSLWLIRFPWLAGLTTAKLYCSDYHWLVLVDRPEGKPQPHKLDDNCPDSHGMDSPGKVTLVPAGVPHQLCHPGGIALTLLFFSRNLVTAHAPNPGGIRRLPKDSHGGHLALHGLIRALATELFTAPDQQVGLHYQRLLTEALFLQCTRSNDAAPQGTSPLLSPNDLQRLLDHIRAHLHGEIGLSQLAALVDLPETQVFQGFQQAMGISPQQYIQTQRLQVVYHLLSQLTLTSGLLGHSTGFPARPHDRLLPLPSRPGASSLDRALAWINTKVLDHTGQPLNNTQVYILTGVLEGRRYGAMAQARGQSEGHLKTTAAKLWQTLSTVLGEPVRKTNLLSYLYRQGFPIQERRDPSSRLA
jgi:hypothetical protein